MVFTTLTALGAPLLTRFAINRAEKHGLLPARHYLRRAMEHLRNERFAEAYRLLQQAVRGAEPALHLLAAVELALMKLDAQLAALETEAARARAQMQQLQKAACPQKCGTRRLWQDWLALWGPAIWSMFWISGLAGGVGVLAVRVTDISGTPTALVLAAGLVLFARHEKKLLAIRRRALRFHRARLQREKARRHQDLREMREALASLLQRQQELSRWRDRFAALLPADSSGALPIDAEPSKFSWMRIKHYVQTKIIRPGRRNSSVPQK